jgi:hypothetical protein
MKAKLLSADGRTNRNDEANSNFSQFFDRTYNPLLTADMHSSPLFLLLIFTNSERHQWRAHIKETWHSSIMKKVTVKVKVKVTLVQALRLCTGRTAHRGSRGIALPFHDHGTRSGWGVSVTPRPLFTPGKDPVPIVQEVGWAPGQVWTGAENLAHAGIRSPDRLTRSHSLYRLSYRAHRTECAPTIGIPTSH